MGNWMNWEYSWHSSSTCSLLQICGHLILHLINDADNLVGAAGLTTAVTILEDGHKRAALPFTDSWGMLND